MPEANNRGLYGFYEYKVVCLQGRSLATWLRIGVADSRVNQLDCYVDISIGIVLLGLLPEKFEDSIGVVLAVARNGADYRFFAGLNTFA